MGSELVRFELNNWSAGDDYPNAEPFISWMGNDLALRFYDEDWVKANKLVVGFTPIDQSANFMITATKSWVEENCPELLTLYKDFIVEEECGAYYSRWGMEFPEYKFENFGTHYISDDVEG